MNTDKTPTTSFRVIPSCLSGATSNQDYRESYSNYGYELDIVAPAGSVTADITGNYGYASGSYSFEFGGTSAATPVAAGIVGLC